MIAASQYAERMLHRHVMMVVAIDTLAAILALFPFEWCAGRWSFF
jgi:hypothetical protein